MNEQFVHKQSGLLDVEQTVQGSINPEKISTRPNIIK